MKRIPHEDLRAASESAFPIGDEYLNREGLLVGYQKGATWMQDRMIWAFQSEMDEFALTFTIWRDVNGWVRCSDGDFRQKKPHNGLVNPTPFKRLVEKFREEHWSHRES